MECADTIPPAVLIIATWAILKVMILVTFNRGVTSTVDYRQVVGV